MIDNKFNNIIRWYLCVSILAYLGYLIAPVVSLVMNTQLYSFQRYLGLVGVVIIIYELVKFKKIRIYSNVLLFTIILILAVISSIMRVNYGFKDNIFDIMWFAIYIYIYYLYAQRVGTEQVKKDIEKLYKIITGIWLIVIILSILSYFFNTAYHILANPYGIYSLTRQGFVENRLFGVFMSINIAAILSGVLIIYGSYRYSKSKIQILISFIFFVYILLSGSRSALVSLMVVLFIYVVYKGIIQYYSNKKHISKILLSLVTALSAVVVMFFGSQVLKIGLAYMPTFSVFTDNTVKYKTLLSKHPRIVVEGFEDSSLVTLEEGVDVKEILSRKDITNTNVSNGRLNIWLDYIKLYKDISFFGLSPSNYSRYIQETHPDLYIVEYIKENHPGMYQNGEIYHPHNTYVMTYVSTGLVGLIIFIGVLIRVFKDALRKLAVHKDNGYMLLVFSIVVYCLVNGLFDALLLFSNEIITCLFWVFLGLLVHISKKEV